MSQDILKNLLAVWDNFPQNINIIHKSIIRTLPMWNLRKKKFYLKYLKIGLLFYE